MLNELEQIPGGAAALSWALGCTLVSYRERVSMMTGSLNNIPRWLLSLEMAVCLVPLTWLFIVALAMTMHGVMPLQVGILVGSAALLGPFSVVVALKIVFFSGSSVSRTTATVMALLAAWTVTFCCEQVISGGAPVSEWWRDLALIALLPAWAVVHLLQINAERRATRAMA